MMDPFDYLLLFFIISGFIFFFPVPQLLSCYFAYSHREYLKCVNERFMREWKSRGNQNEPS